jgi:small nuclear ribonucleoprotein (snRNP)-like protein
MIDNFIGLEVKVFLKNSIVVQGTLKDTQEEIVIEDSTGLFYIDKKELLHYKVFRPQELIQTLEEKQQVISDQVQVIATVANPNLSKLAQLRKDQSEIDKQIIQKRSAQAPVPRGVKYGNQFDVLKK